MTFEGKTIPYKLDYDSTPDEQLTVRLMMNGRQGAETHIIFTPQNDGKDTLITAKVKADHSVLRKELAGTSKARVAYAPDWMLNIALRPVLRQLGEQIEKGETVGPMMGFGGNDPESQLTPEEQRLEATWRQYEAARPMVDPDEAAKNYLGDR